MTTYADNRLKLINSRVAGPIQYPVRYGANGMAPPYGLAAGNYFAQELVQQGFNTNRSAITWTSEAPSSGVYDWTKPDNCIPIQSALGIRPLIQHIFTPTWANVVTPNSNLPYADVPLYTDTTNWNAWVANHVAFATAAATRYSGMMDVEIWNEMNTPSIYWRGGGSTTAAPDWIAYGYLYAALKAAYQAVDPTIKVCVGGILYMDSFVGTGTTGVTYMQNLKTVLDGLSVTPDAVGVHPYILGSTNGDPTIDSYPASGKNGVAPTIRRFQKAMVAAGWGNVPTWVTEFGYISSGPEAGAYNAGSEAQKAIWYRETFDSIYYTCTKQVLGPGQAGVELVTVYKLENYSDGTVDTDSTGLWTGSPTGGPHTQLPAGVTIQDFMHRVRNGLHIPLLSSMAITGPTSAVMTDTPGTYSVSGTDDGGLAMGCTPIFHTSDPTVATISSVFGATTGTLALVAPGTCSVWAHTYNAKRVPIQTPPIVLTVAAQIPTTGTLTPNPFAIAVSTSGTVTMVASYLDQIGGPIAGQPPGTFTSSDPTNAPVDPVTGIVTAVGVSTGVVITFTPTTGNACTATGNVTQNPVLQITNIPSTLINVGALLLTVTDGSNPVSGCTFVISDGTKATMSGQYLVGVGSSGTFTLKAQKASYNDSVLSTITCTGGGILDDKDLIGLSNGASVTSYTDLDGIVWASASPPTYATNDYNGHSSIVFDGVSQFLRSNVAVSRLNGTGFTYLKVFTPTSTAPSSNEVSLDNRDQTHGEGFVLTRNATTMTPGQEYYTTPTNLQLRFDGTALSQNTQYRRIDRVSSGHQSRWVNGVANGITSTDATYRNPVTSPPTVTKGAAIAGSSNPYFFAPEKLGLEIFVNRDVPDTEATQLDQKAQLYIATAATVTSVSLNYTGNTITQNVSANGGMLLMTGVTYQIIAKDQSGNTLSNGSGTWATNATLANSNFQVNSSGQVTPNANVDGGTITFTHTASGQVGTVNISVIKTPAAVYQQDWGYNYANTTALMANIWSNLGSDPNYNGGLPVATGNSSVLYTDTLGAYINHASIDSTTTARLFMGNNAIVNTIPVTIGGAAILRASLGTPSFTRLFAISIQRYDPPFTLQGTNVSSQAYKIAPWIIVDQNGGRVNFELSNGNDTAGLLSVDCTTRNGSSAIGGGGTQNNGTLTTELTNGEWWVNGFVYESRAGNIMSARYCHFKIGSVPTMTYGPSLTVCEGPMVGNPPAGPVPKAQEYSAVGENFNENPPIHTDYHVIAGWMVVDGETAGYGDAFGILADATSPTTTGISGGTISHGTTGNSIVLTGTNYNTNCWPVFSNAKIYAQTITVNSSTQMTVVVSVDSTATTGAGTVLVRNGSSQVNSATQVILVL